MDINTAAVIASSIADYVRRDQNARYGLTATATVTITGAGVGIGDADCGPLSIRSTPGGDVCVLTCSPFDADEGLWNGPDVLPNERKDGSMEASLWHDLIWGFAADIAVQTCLDDAAAVKQWGNGVLYAVWSATARRNGTWSWFNRILARVAYNVTTWSRRWYGKIKG